MSETIQQPMKKSKKKLITSIVLYVIAGLLLLVDAAAIIIRLSGNGDLYLFGNRVDVVLTDSMSEKNEKYKDFLEGHDDQINAFDLVVSKKIDPLDELDVYDIVLFNNPSVGVDMHRVVAKNLIGSTDLTALDADYRILDGYEGICLNTYSSSIISSSISFKEMTIVTYSQEDDAESHYNFSQLSEVLVPSVTSTKEANGTLTTYTFVHEDSTPGPVVINHKKEYDYSKEVIISCEIVLHAGKEPLNLDKSRTVLESNNIVGKFNRVYEYEIRGDKSNTSDGVFKIEDIISKVTNRVPKMGYVVRYLTSIWGIVMFLSLGIIILVFDIMSSRMQKNEEKKKGAEE